MSDIQFKCRWSDQRGHIYARFYAGRDGLAFANVGMLMLSHEEFDEFKSKTPFIDFGGLVGPAAEIRGEPIQSETEYLAQAEAHKQRTASG